MKSKIKAVEDKFKKIKISSGSAVRFPKFKSCPRFYGKNGKNLKKDKKTDSLQKTGASLSVRGTTHIRIATHLKSLNMARIVRTYFSFRNACSEMRELYFLRCGVSPVLRFSVTQNSYSQFSSLHFLL